MVIKGQAGGVHWIDRIWHVMIFDVPTSLWTPRRMSAIGRKSSSISRTGDVTELLETLLSPIGRKASHFIDGFVTNRRLPKGMSLPQQNPRQPSRGATLSKKERHEFVSTRSRHTAFGDAGRSCSLGPAPWCPTGFLAVRERDGKHLSVRTCRFFAWELRTWRRAHLLSAVFHPR